MLVNNQVYHYSTGILLEEGLKKAVIILFINEFPKLNIKYGCDPVSVTYIFFVLCITRWFVFNYKLDLSPLLLNCDKLNERKVIRFFTKRLTFGEKVKY